MFQDLPFLSHSTATASLKLCMFFASHSLNITAENDTLTWLLKNCKTVKTVFLKLSKQQKSEKESPLHCYFFFSVFVKKK